MNKKKTIKINAVLTFVLVAMLSFIAANSVAPSLLAGDCGAGLCSCECVMSECSSMHVKIPFLGFSVSACRCSDGSESCSGASY